MGRGRERGDIFKIVLTVLGIYNMALCYAELLIATTVLGSISNIQKPVSFYIDFNLLTTDLSTCDTLFMVIPW